MPGDEYFASGGIVQSSESATADLFPSWLNTGCYVPKNMRTAMLAMQIDIDVRIKDDGSPLIDIKVEDEMGVASISMLKTVFQKILTDIDREDFAATVTERDE